MIRRIFGLTILGFLMVSGAFCRADDIVVLTQKPVAEFSLPDGTVLKNAYVWRRNSQGIMIIHEGGNYFLNYQTLPQAWKVAYLGEAAAEPEPEPEPEPEVVEVLDRYKIAPLLERVPALQEVTRDRLLEQNLPENLDQGVLALGLFQGLLDKDRDRAKRCLLFIEEKGYSVDGVDLEKLFEPCTKCEGDGSLERECEACAGSGECAECKEAVAAAEKNKKSTSKTNKRKSSLLKKDPCSECDDSTECAACEGEGSFVSSCSKCNGAGKLLDRSYCEILRDKWVRGLNASVTGDAIAPITTSPSAGIEAVLVEMPDFDPEAATYYFSDAYTGGMDAGIIMACVIQTLLTEDYPSAKYFAQMLKLDFPKEHSFDVMKYVKACEVCEASGLLDEDCPACEGSGECAKCGGEGETTRMLAHGTDKCSVCKGEGTCLECGGSGVQQVRCGSCGGEGRVLQRQRCEIKRELLVEQLNAYYVKCKAEAEAEAEAGAATELVE